MLSDWSADGFIAALLIKPKIVTNGADLHYSGTLSNHTNKNGNLILNLFEGFQSAGSKLFSWNGTNQSGQKVTTGIYIYRLAVNSIAYNKKMIFIK